jgi:transcriptional regulator with XRE-family HTH domain
MGKYPRRRQKRLGKKLRQVRTTLGVSQNEMLRRLGLENELSRTNISNYELGQREPPLYVLLRCARVAGVSTDVLIDDGLDLPKKLPSFPEHIT